MNEFVSAEALKAADGYFWEIDKAEFEWSKIDSLPTLKRRVATPFYEDDFVAKDIRWDVFFAILSALSAMLFLLAALKKFFDGEWYFVVPLISLALLSTAIIGSIRNEKIL